VSDDGLQNLFGLVTNAWSTVSGFGTVIFGNASAVDTMASFAAAGIYVLRLTASDGQLSASDDVTVTVSSTSTDQLSVVRRGANHTSTGAISYSFAPVTASNDQLLVVLLDAFIDSGTAFSATSLSGVGLTFTEIGAVGGLLYSGTAVNRIQVWRSLVGSGAATGPIGIDLSGVSTGIVAAPEADANSGASAASRREVSWSRHSRP
jgi:hypothetical protein